MTLIINLQSKSNVFDFDTDEELECFIREMKESRSSGTRISHPYGCNVLVVEPDEYKKIQENVRYYV